MRTLCCWPLRLSFVSHRPDSLAALAHCRSFLTRLVHCVLPRCVCALTKFAASYPPHAHSRAVRFVPRYWGAPQRTSAQRTSGSARDSTDCNGHSLTARRSVEDGPQRPSRTRWRVPVCRVAPGGTMGSAGNKGEPGRLCGWETDAGSWFLAARPLAQSTTSTASRHACACQPMADSQILPSASGSQRGAGRAGLSGGYEHRATANGRGEQAHCLLLALRWHKWRRTWAGGGRGGGGE